MEKNYKYLALAGSSGLLTALSYPGWPIDLGFLAWLGLVPLLYSLVKNPGRRNSFWLSFLAGAVFFLITFRWFWSFYPLDTLGINSGLVSFAIIFVLYAVSALVLAAFWGMFGLAICYLKEAGAKRSFVFWTLAGASIFVLLEYARAYGFGLLWLGSGTLVGPHWTFGSLAYSLVNNHLVLKLSSCVGIYGITFLVVLANFLILKLIEVWPDKKMVRFIGIVIALFLLTLGVNRIYKTPGNNSAENGIRFTIIQTSRHTRVAPDSKETLENFKEQLALLNKAAKEHPENQIIVFPEASDFFKDLSRFLSGVQAQVYFTNLFREPHLLISGARVVDKNEVAYSRVFSLDTKNDIAGYYDKRLLTPGGEFLPYPVRLITNLISKNKVSQFGSFRELQVGRKETSTLNFHGQFSAAPIICSEFISPQLSSSITRGSNVIVGMASYGIFHGKPTFIRQNLALARFRAVENQKPIVMAANMGYSYALDSRGSVFLMAQDEKPQILTGTVVPGHGKSWYNKVGNLPTLLASLLLITGFFLSLRFKGKRQEPITKCPKN